ncbi:hypothetical protein ADL25_21055 [Streptomyces sp. NRRL F-5122]|uniref:hypothetical protein n=1 Tax=Streptomyces sp. NRRL F-5122 TaxID=1609098 RepID=UPI0007412A8A|nr:hypothetical protein [Streptomyces sp. NRRL F-5122]KUJ38761.1 hypothetical protein ADL25_21055 [Streptomyces sp. NRRL F-5122]
MPVRIFHGFAERIERVRREIGDPARRDWFRHHYGHARHQNKSEMAIHPRTCFEELRGYPHLPWITPATRVTTRDVCTRRMCCGWRLPEARELEAVILTDEQYAAFKKAAYDEGMSQEDFAAKLIMLHTNGFARSHAP